jgi:hypothetical protein
MGPLLACCLLKYYGHTWFVTGGEGGAFRPSRLAQQLQWLTSWRQTERTQVRGSATIRITNPNPAEYPRTRSLTLPYPYPYPYPYP